MTTVTLVQVGQTTFAWQLIFNAVLRVKLDLVAHAGGGALRLRLARAQNLIRPSDLDLQIFPTPFTAEFCNHFCIVRGNIESSLDLVAVT